MERLLIKTMKEYIIKVQEDQPEYIQEIKNKLDSILTRIEKLESVGTIPIPVVPKPIEPTPVPVTPVVQPSTGYRNIQDWFYAQLLDPTVSEIIIDGKCEIPTLKRHQINRKLRIKGINNALIKVGIPFYKKYKPEIKQDEIMFHLEHGAELIIEDIDFCQPEQYKDTPEPWRPAFFSSAQFVDRKWTAVIKNCDTTKLGENGGFGMGFLYGSLEGNYLGVFNFRHVGNGFLDAKVSIAGSKDTILGIVLQDVYTDSEDETKYGTHKIGTKGVIKDNVYTILGGPIIDNIKNYTSTFESQGNYAHIIHIGRFTFMLYPWEQINDKQVKLRPLAKGKVNFKVIGGRILTYQVEGHVNDTFILKGVTYKIIEKGKEENPIWSNDYKPWDSKLVYTPYLIADKAIADGEYEVEWVTSFDLEGIEQDTWMLYKTSSFGWRSFPNTKFEDPEIMRGEIVGHNMYNHANITLWAKNVVQKGFYRQTNPGGKSLGYNMVNCIGFKDQFNPVVPITTDQPMPERIALL